MPLVLLVGLLLQVQFSCADPGTEKKENNGQWSYLKQYNYSEVLEIQPFPRNRLLTSFKFESYSDAFYISDIDNKHKFSDFQYGAFPRSLGQVLDQSQSQELHLRFSQGWWDAEGWGAMPRNGSFSGGIGVEVWAAVEGATVTEAQSNWSKLVNSLSGLFCASLNFIDSAQTVFPKQSFRMTGTSLTDKKLHVLRGSLPREPVCTENLTPFIKLLPVKEKLVFRRCWTVTRFWCSMARNGNWRCFGLRRGTKMCKWKLLQVIDVVIDVPRSLRRKDSPIPKPLAGEALRCDPLNRIMTIGSASLLATTFRLITCFLTYLEKQLLESALYATTKIKSLQSRLIAGALHH